MDNFDFKQIIPDDYQFSMFVVMHWFRMMVVWFHKTFILPIEVTLKQYDKVEPTERRWVQHYTMIADSDINEFGCVDCYYKSLEKYNYPCTRDFNSFVENEVNGLLENIESSSNIIENLIIVKNKTIYVVRSFSFPQQIQPICPIDFLKKSAIIFPFIEYYHPKMINTLELELDEGFYTIGNELLTSAFILRQLDLLNVSYVFDDDYEIRFVDHDINEQCLKSDEHIEIEAKSYKIIKSI